MSNEDLDKCIVELKSKFKVIDGYIIDLFAINQKILITIYKKVEIINKKDNSVFAYNACKELKEAYNYDDLCKKLKDYIV